MGEAALATLRSYNHGAPPSRPLSRGGALGAEYRGVLGGWTLPSNTLGRMCHFLPTPSALPEREAVGSLGFQSGTSSVPTPVPQDLPGDPHLRLRMTPEASRNSEEGT